MKSDLLAAAQPSLAKINQRQECRTYCKYSQAVCLPKCIEDVSLYLVLGKVRQGLPPTFTTPDLKLRSVRQNLAESTYPLVTFKICQIQELNTHVYICRATDYI